MRLFSCCSERKVNAPRLLSVYPIEEYDRTRHDPISRDTLNFQTQKHMPIDVDNFEDEVIQTSRRVPVLVDFWAPWCGPCHALGPILERLAERSDGKWKLAKLNTDEHPDVSQRYGIRGIPAVKLIVDGEVVDEFTGALPEYAVTQWLEKALPSENKKRLARAESAIEEGNESTAESLLEEILEDEPQNPKARLLLARILAFREPQRAADLATVSAFAGTGFVQIEEAVKTVARLFQLAEDTGALPEGDGRGTYLSALKALTSRDFDTALERFIEVIRTDRYYDDDGARKACVAVFTLLGDDHPVVKKYRRKFDMALY